LPVTREEPLVTNVPPTYQRRRDGRHENIENNQKRLEEVKDIQEQAMK